MAPLRQLSLKRLLIANRGEIAVRIARGAHSLGIDAVGVFSEVDRGALHVAEMDLAVALGGTSAAESYLRGDLVIEAAQRTNCDAVHPGYGFLAENAQFARDVEAAGLIWVGPTPEQIELLGDKVAAKQAAVDAGVPTTQAVVVGPETDFDALPLPAMVKAAAGGGGRGMRVVTQRTDFEDVVASASREAAAAFGDGTVFVEPLIEAGRHVEVQILGDQHGNVVHLGERDCSIQRRHQKVIEEAPSPGIDDATRTKLCDGAVALARSVGYVGAGTVEYLVGGDGTVAFLEVNTRLQVEHPVTEAVWGVDLVQLQLRVAAGEELPFTQDDLQPIGHAIEARLVAEDPAARWLPGTGALSGFSIEGPGIRLDTGVASGSVVSAEYDSLLAKVVAFGEDRRTALDRLGRALRTAAIFGVPTNANALTAICDEPDFGAGRATTAYLEDHPEVLEAGGPGGDDRVAQYLAAVFATESLDRAADRSWGFAPSGWRNVATQGQRRTLIDLAASGDPDGAVMVEYTVTSDSRSDDGGRAPVHSLKAEVLLGQLPQPDSDGALEADQRRAERVAIRIDRRARRTQVEECDEQRVTVELAGIERTHLVHRRADGTIDVSGATGRTSWQAVSPFSDIEAAEAGTAPVSPLPGSVVSVHVAAGDSVSDGDLLVVIEAMKMEHRIEARGTHTINSVAVVPGDKVDAGTVLVTFDE